MASSRTERAPGVRLNPRRLEREKKIMITVKRLKELLADLLDEATAAAYEGECIGITIRQGNLIGWIDTGSHDRPADESKHLLPLQKFRSAKSA